VSKTFFYDCLGQSITDKGVYLVKEESAEESESLQGVEAVKKERELDYENGVLQVPAKEPRDQFSNPGLEQS
jgi:hypothetical protein